MNSSYVPENHNAENTCDVVAASGWYYDVPEWISVSGLTVMHFLLDIQQ